MPCSAGYRATASTVGGRGGREGETWYPPNMVGRPFLLLALLATGCAPSQDKDAGDPAGRDCLTVEVSYDGGDNDCDPATPDDDLDGDGWPSARDCDDRDATAGGGREVPYDGIDNDCDESTLDDDFDGDGLPFAEDCDDQDPHAGGGEEAPYDGMDNDCDPATLDDDLDGDGDCERTGA